MKRNSVLLCLLGALVLLGGARAFAQAEVPKTGLRAEVLVHLKDVEDKLVALAEKMPQEKYTWRPGEGVRSVSEVFMHVASANFSMPRMIGVQPPQGLAPDLEKITDKAKVIETLKQSYAHVRDAVLKLSDADLSKPVRVYGRDSTTEGALLAIISHGHEHLGQSIAYARVNGFVPPWTEERQRRQQQAPKKAP
jgi:uncharacterized damage-inducible protein DinB